MEVSGSEEAIWRGKEPGQRVWLGVAPCSCLEARTFIEVVDHLLSAALSPSMSLVKKWKAIVYDLAAISFV